MRTSKHYKNERTKREELIQAIGEGEEYERFTMWDARNNVNVYHIITTNAIIILVNARTGRLITKLIARPGQIKRYYEYGQYPQDIVKKAMEHQRLGYNKVA